MGYQYFIFRHAGFMLEKIIEDMNVNVCQRNILQHSQFPHFYKNYTLFKVETWAAKVGPRGVISASITLIWKIIP